MVGKGPCAVSTNVSKPEKHGSGRSAVVDYLITTTFDGDDESKFNESLVRRTFEDFNWVQERLVKERMGIIIPILSKKKPAKNKDTFHEPFINMRQDSLDRFLQRIIHHPELVDAPCLLPFFTENSTEWLASKSSSKTTNDKDVLLKENTTDDDESDFAVEDTVQINAHAAMIGPNEEKQKGPLRKWFANKRTEWALKKESLNLEETPAEAKQFADIKTYADHLEVCVRILSEDFNAMQSSNSVLGEKMGTMGAAFSQMWGEHDLSNTSSSNLYQSLGKVWSNVSNRIENQTCFGDRYFQSPVDDLVMDVVALQYALAQRKSALYTYTKITEQGKNLNRQLDRIKGNIDSQPDRYFKLESQLRHCDDKTAECRNLSDLVTTRLARDIERFRVEWHEHMRQVLEVFHKQQVEFLKNQARDFSAVLPILATVNLERSNVVKKAPEPEKFEINFSVNSGGAKASIIGTNPDSAVSEVPSTTAPELPPPPLPPVEDSPGEVIQSINFDDSFSSGDGFDTESAGMGGESQSKPILKSV